MHELSELEKKYLKATEDLMGSMPDKFKDALKTAKEHGGKMSMAGQLGNQFYRDHAKGSGTAVANVDWKRLSKCELQEHKKKWIETKYESLSQAS